MGYSVGIVLAALMPDKSQAILEAGRLVSSGETQ
jgi:hypothetical protein